MFMEVMCEVASMEMCKDRYGNATWSSPPMGGSGDLAGAQGSEVVGGEVTREGGPDTGEPQGSV